MKQIYLIKVSAISKLISGILDSHGGKHFDAGLMDR